jgi:hypothetical protein
MKIKIGIILKNYYFSKKISDGSNCNGNSACSKNSTYESEFFFGRNSAPL